MSESFAFADDTQPVARRVGGHYRLNDAAAALVRQKAKQFGMNPDKAQADVERGLAAARLLLAVLGVPVAHVRSGRPLDNEHYNLIRLVAGEMVAKHGPELGWDRAATELAKRGVTGSRGKKLSSRHLRDECRKSADPERSWFQLVVSGE